MTLRREQAHAIAVAVWLFGLAALFYTGRWWPGILFVIGISSIIEGLVLKEGWHAFEWGAVTIFVGAWALARFQLWFFFVMAGVSVLLGALAPRPILEKKPRPPYEADLE